MKIVLNKQQLCIEDWNVVTFYNKATVATSWKIKMLNCLHEYSITLMCIILLFLLCPLITFNMPHNPWSAVTLTITLKAIIMTQINFASHLNCLAFSLCLFLQLYQTSFISLAREWTRVCQNKLTNLAYSFHICSRLSLLLQIIVCLCLNNNHNPKI